MRLEYRYLKLVWILLLVLHTNIIFCNTNSQLSNPDNYKINLLFSPILLANQEVGMVYKDYYNYIWIGTNYGLFRYDGNNVFVYRKIENDTNSLMFNKVSLIFEDSEKNLCIIGNVKNVYCKYNRDYDNFSRHSGDFYTNTYNLPIPIDSKNKNYICSRENIYKLNRKSQKYELVNVLNRNNETLDVNSYVEDKQGKLWIGSFTKGFYKFDTIHNKLVPILPFPENNTIKINFRITQLFYDSYGLIWIGGLRDEIDLFDPVNEIYVNKWNNNNNPQKISLDIKGVCEDVNRQVWLASENGINVYNHNSKKFTALRNKLNNPSSINSNIIKSLFTDQSGLIIIGTFDGGVSVYNPNKIKFQNNLPFINNNENKQIRSFKSIYSDINKNLWVGTDYGLIKLTENGTFIESVRHENSTSNRFIIGGVCAIDEDINGNIYIGTWGGGLCIYNRQYKKYFPFNYDEKLKTQPNQIGDANVLCIKVDNKGFVWMGTVLGILDIYDIKNKRFKHLNLNTEFIRSILIDDENNAVWCCTDNGLFMINQTTHKVTNYTANNNLPNSLSSNYTTNIVKDKNGSFWITTLNGLNKFNYKNNTFKNYFIINDVKLENLYGLQIDNNGSLWFSSNTYLLKFNPETEKIWYYNHNDGVILNIKYSSKLNTGQFVFGGSDGVNIFYPDSIKSNIDVPNIVFTDFKIFNKSVYNSEFNILDKTISQTQQINISYKYNVFGFDFTVQSYKSDNKCHYAYKLEGFDKNWIYIGDKKSVTFSYIPAGKYILRVKASNNEGYWNNNEITMKLNIIPPFWKTIWFKLLLITTLILSVTLWIKYNIKSVTKRNERLERLVKTRTNHLQAANEKLEEQKTEIERMAKVVHDTDQKRIRFLINISHEFRTPLTLIINPIEKLLSKISGNKELEYMLQLIYKNSRSLLNLINQVMDIRKLETNNMSLKVSNNNLQIFLEGIFESFGYLAESQNIKYTFNCNLPNKMACFDSPKLERVLINLLSNAFKFTPKGGSIEFKAILFENNEKVKISIIDTGIGIPTDQLAYVFDRYYQVKGNKEQSTSMYGTGIGLNLAKDLIELHHGVIYVSSVQGQGSCFTVELPIVMDNYLNAELIYDDSQSKNSESEVLVDDVNLNHNELEHDVDFDKDSKVAPLVLIVEDNTDLRLFVKQNLEVYYNIIEAENGLVGIEQILKYLPDLIISDIVMPKMNGFDLCRKVKTDENICHIPIILLTSQLDNESQLTGLQINADDYITKPFNINILKARVDNILENRKIMQKRFAKEFKIGPNNLTLTSLDQQFLEKAIALVEKNIADTDFDVVKFSSYLNFSSRQIQNKLKALTNLSPSDFIRNIRLKRAAQLILQSGYNISEIAYETGFSNPKYFSTAFKKYFGVSPSEFTGQAPL